MFYKWTTYSSYIGINKTWIGIYDSSKNGILHNSKLYQGISPLNQFAISHYESEISDRISVNASFDKIQELREHILIDCFYNEIINRC